MFASRFWKNFDWILALAAGLLLALGLLVIYSTSFKAADLVAPVKAENQLLFATLGVAGLFAAARFDYHAWARLSYILYGITIALLLIVMVSGHSALGATRWIDIGFFQFQPSEFAKLALIIFFANYFSQRYDRLDRFRYVLISLVYLAVPVLLVLRQPDLGTAMVLMAIWLVMAVAAKVRWQHFAILLGAAALALPFALRFLHPYQLKRLETFLNPTADQLGTGYNVVQSTIAVGSGQLFGRGLASGSQSQLNFLPSQATDFIFAVLSEKLGMVGGLLVIGLFMTVLVRGYMIAAQARDRFGFFLAAGITTMLLFHAVVNIGMNIGLLPVTGIPLPFISYGGTSLLVSMIGIGLLESVAVRRHKIQFGT